MCPILFIAFNRPEATQRVFSEIRNIQPTKLYIALDGPRDDVCSDELKVKHVISTVRNINWQCDARFLIRDKNVGCKKAVSSAIDWFFQHESAGIILEDDCLPSTDFFYFCKQLLLHHRDDQSVWCITGDNFQGGMRRGTASYYYSKYPHIWGWATWKRCWDSYDVGMSFWPTWRESTQFKQLFRNRAERTHWRTVFDRVYAGQIDTWDFQWLATVWRNGGLTATPQSNLVTNIGHGVDATHTKKPNPKLCLAHQALNIESLSHPVKIQSNGDADRYTFQHVFQRKVHRQSMFARLNHLANIVGGGLKTSVAK
jgi:hypothetical protein